MTTGDAGDFDLVAAIVMAILAGVLVWVSVYTTPWLWWCLRIVAAFLIIVAARAAWVTAPFDLAEGGIAILLPGHEVEYDQGGNSDR